MRYIWNFAPVNDPENGRVAIVPTVRDSNLVLQDSFTPAEAREIAAVLIKLADEVAPKPKKTRSRAKPKVGSPRGN